MYGSGAVRSWIWLWGDRRDADIVVACLAGQAAVGFGLPAHILADLNDIARASAFAVCASVRGNAFVVLADFVV